VQTTFRGDLRPGRRARGRPAPARVGCNGVTDELDLPVSAADARAAGPRQRRSVPKALADELDLPVSAR
jgi:hypothetical protein